MELLDQAYDQKKYLDFLADKFNFSKSLQAIIIENNEVESFEQLGFISTADNKQLPIFEIYIKPNTKLARNRVQLRNLVAKQIKTEDGALAVYVDENSEQWRFSFIAIEYELGENGIKKKQTASKRFTYLFGEGTQTITAKKRFEILNKQSTLENFKTAFAVEQLNKDFYGELYKWYKNAQSQVTFPNDEGENQQKHIKNSLIRLLTRLLFIWFLKEKHLINPNLFNLNQLKDLIDWNKDSSFYKAILQNLFFATLNRKINERSFRTTTNGNANSNNYLATSIYRYQKYFIKQNKQDIMALFVQTPFLNGGLFECLDREATDEEKQDYNNNIRPVKSAIRIDGFSDKDSNELVFDNALFFNYDKNNLGLISLFEQYQFTVEESTPLDIEVALDPELLGKVFENLLASYNPETGEQARKATGSFYTPREIVNYMVDESLKQHFKIHTNLTQEGINTLFIEGENLPNKKQIKTIISAIDGLKILDPAVGSGAYPMGVLQRLVFILEKIDPENKHFKQQQLDKAELMDEASKNASIKAIEQVFSTENQHNTYGKKLFLIENCIYGVDIQAIAIQICKLRFFISLTIEQTADKSKENYGIKALPNLETKFIVANTLLPLGKIEVDKNETIGLFDEGIGELQRDLAKTRHQYFTAKTLRTKRKYREEDKQLRQQMQIKLKDKGITLEVETSMQKVVAWDLYNQNSVSNWFDPEWMFGVKEGFDIVIGNPPYVRADSGIAHLNFRNTLLKTKTYKTLWEKWDLYTAFIEKGFNVLSRNGILTYIIPLAYLSAKYALKSRKFFVKNARIDRIDFLMDLDIFDASVKNIIFQYSNADSHNHRPKRLKHKAIKNPNTEKFSDITVLETNTQSNLGENVFNETLKKSIVFKNTVQWGDIFYVSVGLVLNANENEAKGLFQKSDLITNIKDKRHPKPYIEGKDIKSYKVERIRYLEWGTKRCPDLVRRPTFSELYTYPKIMQGGMTGAIYDNNGMLANHSITISIFWRHLKAVQNRSINNSIAKGFHVKGKAQIASKRQTLNAISQNFEIKYCLAILNSKFAKWFFNQVRRSVIGLYPNDIKQLPIPKVSKTAQQPFIKLVDKILTAKQNNQNTTDLEAKIDDMVYQLYSLTPAEIKIIEDSK